MLLQGLHALSQARTHTHHTPSRHKILR